MTKFWGTFRIEERTIGTRTAAQRRADLYKVIGDRSTSWWLEPTSFMLFESTFTIDQLMAAAYAAIAPTADLFVVRHLGVAEARAIGRIENEKLLVQFMPYIKRWLPARNA